MSEQDSPQDYFYCGNKEIPVVVTSRAVILDPKGNFPLIRYRKTVWYGLPGGKAKADEVLSGNLLGDGAFATLLREIDEECCGLPKGKILNFFCLGLAETIAFRPRGEPTIYHLAPIFAFLVEEEQSYRGDAVRVANINSHLPGPLFPDARLGIEQLKRVLRGEAEPVPQFLNGDQLFYVRTGPEPRLLMRSS